MQPFTRTRPAVRKQFRIEGKVGAVRADEVIARRGGFVDDRQQWRFVVLLQKTCVQSGFFAQRGDLVAEIVAAHAAGKGARDAEARHDSGYVPWCTAGPRQPVAIFLANQIGEGFASADEARDCRTGRGHFGQAALRFSRPDANRVSDKSPSSVLTFASTALIPRSSAVILWGYGSKDYTLLEAWNNAAKGSGGEKRGNGTAGPQTNPRTGNARRGVRRGRCCCDGADRPSVRLWLCGDRTGRRGGSAHSTPCRRPRT